MKILTRKKELEIISYIQQLKRQNGKLLKENAALKNDVSMLKSMLLNGFVSDVDFPNTHEGSKTNKGNIDINDIFSNY